MHDCMVHAMKSVLLLPFATFGIFHLCFWGGFGILNPESAGASPHGNTLKSAVHIIGWGLMQYSSYLGAYN